jgi:hypothetical protein
MQRAHSDEAYVAQLAHMGDIPRLIGVYNQNKR